jgi:hypothetical protein
MAATLVAACEHIVDPALPTDAVPFTPPSVYTRWWAMTQSCSGRSGSLSSVKWNVVPNTADFQLNGETVTSYWTEASNSIVIASAKRLDGSIVRHEMLHALTRAPGHSRIDFLELCGGIVTCTSRCVADGGPIPAIDPALPHISPDSLDVNIQLVPAQPSMGIDSGAFTLVVSVHNHATNGVVVDFGGGRFGYSYDIGSRFTGGNTLTGTAYLPDPSSIVFAPGETKYQYFDFTVGLITSGRSLGPGTYDITAGFGNHRPTLTPVSISSL